MLVKCFGGCDQSSVIAALRACSLWPGKADRNWRPDLEPLRPQRRRNRARVVRRVGERAVGIRRVANHQRDALLGERCFGQGGDQQHDDDGVSQNAHRSVPHVELSQYAMPAGVESWTWCRPDAVLAKG